MAQIWAVGDPCWYKQGWWGTIGGIIRDGGGPLVV